MAGGGGRSGRSSVISGNQTRRIPPLSPSPHVERLDDGDAHVDGEQHALGRRLDVVVQLGGAARVVRQAAQQLEAPKAHALVVVAQRRKDDVGSVGEAYEGARACAARDEADERGEERDDDGRGRLLHCHERSEGLHGEG